MTEAGRNPSQSYRGCSRFLCHAGSLQHLL